MCSLLFLNVRITEAQQIDLTVGQEMASSETVITSATEPGEKAEKAQPWHDLGTTPLTVALLAVTSDPSWSVEGTLDENQTTADMSKASGAILWGNQKNNAR